MEQTADAHGAAHPRVGGENWMTYSVAQWVRGSSPRRRGKHAEAVGVAVTDRLIPA